MTMKTAASHTLHIAIGTQRKEPAADQAAGSHKERYHRTAIALRMKELLNFDRQRRRRDQRGSVRGGRTCGSCTCTCSRTRASTCSRAGAGACTCPRACAGSRTRACACSSAGSRRGDDVGSGGGIDGTGGHGGTIGGSECYRGETAQRRAESHIELLVVDLRDSD